MNYTNNKVIDRQSNFELMRIVSMFMIVVWHIIIHGKVLDNTIGTMHILITMLLFICQVHVSSFILLTGYFQCDKKFKMNNLISIVNAAWFYKMIFTIIFIVVGNFFIPAIDKIFSFIPVDYNNYWFINLYILLYLLSPALNIIINNASKKKLQAIIFIAFFIISILSTFTVQVTYNDKGGTSLGFFILLYFIGAYLKRYPINKNNIYKIFNNNLFFRLLCFFLLIFIVFIRISILKFGDSIINYGSIMKFIGIVIKSASFSYDGPLLIFQTILYFLFFSTFNFKNKFINFLAKNMLGIYLIHDNTYVRKILYLNIFKFPLSTNYGKIIFIKIFVVAIIVFVICLIVEIIRRFIFKLIYNTKFANKFRNWYQNIPKVLNIDINW